MKISCSYAMSPLETLLRLSTSATSSSMSLLAILFRLMRVLMTVWLALSSSIRKARMGYLLALLLEIVHSNHSKLTTFINNHLSQLEPQAICTCTELCQGLQVSHLLADRHLDAAPGLTTSFSPFLFLSLTSFFISENVENFNLLVRSPHQTFYSRLMLASIT